MVTAKLIAWPRSCSIVRSSANKITRTASRPLSSWKMIFGKSNARRQGKIDKMSLTVEFSDLSVGIRTLCYLHRPNILPVQHR